MFYRFSAASLALAILTLTTIMVSCGKGGSPTIPSDGDLAVTDQPPGLTGLVTGDAEISLGKPVARREPGDYGGYAPDEVLVALKDGIIPTDPDGHPAPGTLTAAVSLMADHGLGIKKVIPLGWGTVYRLDILDGTPVADKVTELRGLPEVEIAEPNYQVHFCDVPYFPNDPLWENPKDDDDDPRTTVFEQFGPSKIGASVVWNDTKGSEDVVVCVIDTGIQVWHEDLANTMWINEDEIPGNGEDDDENGYVDDIYGWDMAGDDPDITDTGGGSYHGTGCSGVVAADQDNNLGCTGIAPGCRLMGIKIPFTSAFASAVIGGVEYAKDNGASVITMSFITTSDSDTMRLTMEDAYSNGLILVAGAGNDEGTWVYYPCSWDCCVKVGGTSPFSQAWAYAPIDEVRISTSAGFGWGSTYGNGQEVMAFGEHYITTFGGGPDEYWDGKDDFFFGGTSNATPMVAASFALLKTLYPGQSAVWLRERLRETADDLHQAGYDQETGYGRVNVIRAVYGADRYAAEEDLNGFVDLAPHGNEVIDSLHNVSGDYLDTEDLYKITAPDDGVLIFDLDIWTWGEDLDLEIYDDPALTPDHLVDSSTGENHAASSFEGAGAYCEAGSTYYARVTTGGLGDSTTYTLSADIVEPFFELETDTLDPGFVHQQGSNLLVGYLDFSVGFRVHLSELIISHRGSMPADKLTGARLYRDTNRNWTFDGGDQLIASAVWNETNRARLSGFDEQVLFNASPQRFFLTVDISGVTEDAEFVLLLTSYKDVSTVEEMELAYDVFPKVMGPYQVGVDTEAPTWDDTVGVQEAAPRYEGAMVYWNSASDPLTPPVEYNVYWTQELPFDFGSAQHTDHVSFSGGGDYDHKWQINNLINGELYYVAVRAEDQAGNEEENTEYLEVTPSAVSDPTAPQVIGSIDTNNAWEVAVDPANERIFVADSNGGVLVLDVSDPTDPSVAGHVSAPNVHGVDFDGTYVYAAGGSGLLIVDPDGAGGAELIGTQSFPSALDVCVVGNWAYLTNESNDLLPVDVGDPYDPDGYPIVESGYYGFGMDAQGGYLYVATYYKPRIYDLSDPSAPNHVRTFGGYGAYEIDAMGDRLYVTYWSEDRFSIYDISNPTNPNRIGGWTSNTGSAASDMVRYNGFLYFGTNNWGIEVLNDDVPDGIFELGQVHTNGPDGLETDGLFVYSAENEHGVKVIL